MLAPLENGRYNVFTIVNGQKQFLGRMGQDGDDRIVEFAPGVVDGTEVRYTCLCALSSDSPGTSSPTSYGIWSMWRSQHLVSIVSPSRTKWPTSRSKAAVRLHHCGLAVSSCGMLRMPAAVNPEVVHAIYQPPKEYNSSHHSTAVAVTSVAPL